MLIGVGTGAYAQGGYAVIQTCIDPSDMSYGISFIMIGKSENGQNGNSIAHHTY